MNTLHIFSSPLADSGVLRHDSGVIITGVAEFFKGRPCIDFRLPDGIPNGHGCEIELKCHGKVSIRFRGILYLRKDGFNYPWAVAEQDAAIEQDDCYFVDEKICPEPIPCPDPNPDPIPTEPIDIIAAALAEFPLHSQRKEMLTEAARNLNAAGISSGGRGPFGLLKKEVGNNCDLISCDIIAAGENDLQGQWDVLINDSIPAWNGPKTIADGIRVDDLILV